MSSGQHDMVGYSTTKTVTIVIMIEIVEKYRREIAELCRKYGVRRLDLFGSAASGDFHAAESDIDFFFEFDANPIGLADRYFGLAEDLARLLGCAVDLVSSRDAHNPYFLQIANQHRVTLYAA